jgi:CheY-like chemotaxis protein
MAKKILLVEDHPYLRAAMADYLREVGGHEVVTASTAEEADKAFAKSSDFDVVVTDYNLGRGKLTGADLARQLRSRGFTGGVIGMSSDPGNWPAFREAGANNFHSKLLHTSVELERLLRSF